jgi:hypothetical protein
VSHAWSELWKAAEAIAVPAPLTAFEPLLAPVEAAVGARIAASMRAQLEARMRIDETPTGRRVLALGDTRHAELLALLRASDTPLVLDEVRQTIGKRFKVPDEIIYFDGGRVGLKQHVPDFDVWKQRLVPAARTIVETVAPERQWSCSELLDELREDNDLPPWLTPWGLAALIKDDGALKYVGRLRVVLPGAAATDGRLFVHEIAEQILREAGGAMTRDELTTKIRARTAAPDLALAQVLGRPQFVRLDGEHMGLLDRDVPGGSAAVTEALDHVEALLVRRERGVSASHATKEVNGLSATHAEWTLPLVVSVLHGDGRFRNSVHGAIGLAAWESVRFPTRLELARGALVESGERVSVEAISTRIAAYYGEAPNRMGLGSLAMNIGATLEGEWVVRKLRAGTGEEAT